MLSKHIAIATSILVASQLPLTAEDTSEASPYQSFKELPPDDSVTPYNGPEPVYYGPGYLAPRPNDYYYDQQQNRGNEDSR